MSQDVKGTFKATASMVVTRANGKRYDVGRVRFWAWRHPLMWASLWFSYFITKFKG